MRDVAARKMRQHKQAYHAERVHLWLLCQHTQCCRTASAAKHWAGKQWGTVGVVVVGEQDASVPSIMVWEMIFKMKSVKRTMKKKACYMIIIFLRKQASGGKKCWARLGKGFYALC